MKKRMLIDANHPEETRVVVLDGSRVEEFDFEAASRRPLKGNIYLAKVTRVEPSLQAAFVEYGGNRQGFLAFSEIHPDYYQIPFADRQALIAEQEAEARRRSEDDIESFEIGSKREDSEEEKEEAEDEAEIVAEEIEEEGAVLDAATIGLPENAAEAGSEEAAAAEERSDAAEDGEDIFVNHVGRPDEEPDDAHDEDERPEDLSKPRSRRMRMGRLRPRPESLEAIAAEENEGEIEPVSGDGAAAVRCRGRERRGK